MAKSGKKPLRIDTIGVMDDIKPKLDDAERKMSEIWNQWAKNSIPEDLNDGGLSKAIEDQMYESKNEIGTIWQNVLAVINKVSAAEIRNKNLISSLETYGVAGFTTTKSNKKSNSKNSKKSTGDNLRDSLSRGQGWYEAVVGEKNAKDKEQLARAKELWSSNIENNKSTYNNINNVGNIKNGNASSVWEAKTGSLASNIAVGTVSSATADTSNFNNMDSTETQKTEPNNMNNLETIKNEINGTKTPESVSNIIKLYDDNGEPLIISKIVDGKDTFYDAKTGEKLTTIGAEGTEWSNEITYLQKAKELAAKNESETNYYATVDSKNGRVVLLGKVAGEWSVLKTYDSNFKTKNLTVDKKEETTIDNDTINSTNNNIDNTTNNLEQDDNTPIGIWKVKNKEEQNVTGEKYWTIYTRESETNGKMYEQGFYATNKNLTDYKNEENCGLYEEAAKWIYDNIPINTTIEVI